MLRKLIRIPTDVELPLIGLIQIGLIDRGTNLIQVRPISGCNLNCIFCSVDEGPNSRTRVTNYFITDLDYLLDWFKWIVKLKGARQIEAHIDGAGEPLLHPAIIELVHMLSDVPGVEVVSMQTNGLTLDGKLITELSEAGLSRINISLHTLDEEKAKMLVGWQGYRLKKVIDALHEVVNTRTELLVAPVWVHGMTDSDAVKIIESV